MLPEMGKVPVVFSVVIDADLRFLQLRIVDTSKFSHEMTRCEGQDMRRKFKLVEFSLLLISVTISGSDLLKIIQYRHLFDSIFQLHFKYRKH